MMTVRTLFPGFSFWHGAPTAEKGIEKCHGERRVPGLPHRIAHGFQRRRNEVDVDLAEAREGLGSMLSECKSARDGRDSVPLT